MENDSLPKSESLSVPAKSLCAFHPIYTTSRRKHSIACFHEWAKHCVENRKKENVIKMLSWGLDQLNIKNKNTKANTLSRVVKLVGQKFGTDSELYLEARKIFNLKKEEKEERDQNMFRSRFKRAECCLEIDMDKVKGITIGFAESDMWYRQFIAVAISTGLRLTEIAKTATIQGFMEEGIKITGLAKKRGADGVYDRKILFLDSKKIPLLLDKVRDELKERYPALVSSDTIPKIISATLTKEVRRVFEPSWNFHRLRAAYAYISWKTFAASESLPCWIQKALNHNTLSMTSSLNYCTVQEKDKIYTKEISTT